LSGEGHGRQVTGGYSTSRARITKVLGIRRTQSGTGRGQRGGRKRGGGGVAELCVHKLTGV